MKCEINNRKVDFFNKFHNENYNSKREDLEEEDQGEDERNVNFIREIHQVTILSFVIFFWLSHAFQLVQTSYLVIRSTFPLVFTSQIVIALKGIVAGKLYFLYQWMSRHLMA